jgi:Polysaccharide biosynthesis/export protein
MRIARINQTLSALGGIWAAMLCLSHTGCTVMYSQNAVPASRLPLVYQAENKCCRVPVNFTLLRQEPVKEYRLGGGDVIGVYVQGILPPKVDEIPLIQHSMGGANASEIYPAGGMTFTPNIGLPITLNGDGTVELPLLAPINLTGKTVQEATTEILSAYKAKDVLPAGRERVNVALVRQRTHRVLVLREDVVAEAPQFLRKDSVPYTRKGVGEVIDLPAYENDVLHVLAATGGLPGIETYNHIWVLKSTSAEGSHMDARARIESGEDAEQVFRALDAKRTAIKIPLRVKPGEPLSFGPQDVILNEGDIVYLESRDRDVFYTGGLLPGGEVPLPRDRDIDILEAIALVNGSVGGPGGVTGAAVFRSGAGPGNIVPPTRALILRKLPNGQQLQIRCDLARAKRDPLERITIQPGDFIMLHYKPGELAGNVALNFFNFNFTYLVGG